MATTPAQQAVIDNIPGHKGWRITNGPESRPATKKSRVPVMVGGKATGEFEEREEPIPGSFIWDIVSPDGTQVDRITVHKTIPTPASGVYVDPDNPNATSAPSAPTYTVTQGPSNEQPTPSGSTQPPVNTEKVEIEGGRWVTKKHTGNGVWTVIKDNGPVSGDKNPPKGTTKKEIQSGRLVTVEADGLGNWSVTSLGEDVNPPAGREPKQPKGQTRQTIQAGRLVTEVADGFGGWSVQDAGTVLSGGDKPAEGTTRRNVVQGMAVTEVYSGGSWVVDPTVAPSTYGPPKPPSVVSAPSTQQTIVTQNADGTFSSTPNPAYQPAATQRFKELFDGISNIEGMLARGEVDAATANKYKDLLRQNFDASLKGTTPYQLEQDRLTREQTRMTSGQSLLNQRVASGSGLAQSLLSSAVGIVGNKNFMDPSAIEGFSPFSGAANYVTELGGGQGVYDAASGAVTRGLQGEQQMSDPAAALLQAALNRGGGAKPISENVGSGAASNPQGPSVLDPSLLPPGAVASPYSSGGLGPVVVGNSGQPPVQPAQQQAPTIDGSTDPGLALLQAALGGKNRRFGA